jgi:hypothetical protein
VIVVKKQFELQIQFTEMGSQKYLFHYACPPSFLSAVLLADWRACPPLHLPPLEPMPELLVTVKLINEFLVAL